MTYPSSLGSSPRSLRKREAIEVATVARDEGRTIDELALELEAVRRGGEHFQDDLHRYDTYVHSRSAACEPPRTGRRAAGS